LIIRTKVVPVSARHHAPARKPGVARLRELPVALPLAVVVLVGIVVVIDVFVGGRPSLTVAAPAAASSTVPRTAPRVLAPTAATNATGAAIGPTHQSADAAAAAAARLEGKPGDPVAELNDLSAGVGASGISVAALNTATGATFSYGATGAMVMGSIAKLDILETLLLQHEDTHTTLSDNDDSLATSMIEVSDNDAADALWAEIGSDPAVSAANVRLGIPNLVVGTAGLWGLGTTNATDQLTLLKNLTTTGGPLDAASQTYALNLMRNVSSDQRWGVGAAADPGTVFANKNGWLANDADNDLWLVNSDGIVTVQGQLVLISVLTQHNADENAGIALVEQVASAVTAAVAP
jgi:beta-lactamase class A